MDDVPGQDVEFDLFDKDIDKDDFLGRWVLGGHGGGRGAVWWAPQALTICRPPPPRCKVPLRRVLSSRIVDEVGERPGGGCTWGGGACSKAGGSHPPSLSHQWLPLEEVKSGRLHVRLESLAPSPSTALLEQVTNGPRLARTSIPVPIPVCPHTMAGPPAHPQPPSPGPAHQQPPAARPGRGALSRSPLRLRGPSRRPPGEWLPRHPPIIFIIFIIFIVPTPLSPSSGRAPSHPPPSPAWPCATSPPRPR